MNISKKKAYQLEMTLYACYCDGGDPITLAAHAIAFLEISIEQKVPAELMCNWRDHVPGGRVYERNEVRPPS